MSFLSRVFSPHIMCSTRSVSLTICPFFCSVLSISLSLRAAQSPVHHHLLIKDACFRAFDKRERECRLTSQMLLRLCEDGVLTRDQLLAGLRVMLDMIEVCARTRVIS